jgi:hypothetical protein
MRSHHLGEFLGRLTANDKVTTVLGPPIPASSDTVGGTTDEAVGNKERLLYCILRTGDCPRWLIKKKSWICWQVAKKGHLWAESCLRIRMLNLLLKPSVSFLINAHNVQRILHCRHYQKIQMHIISPRKGEVQSNSWKHWNFSSKTRQLTEWNRIAGFQPSKKSHHSCIAISNDNIYNFVHVLYPRVLLPENLRTCFEPSV